MSHLTLPALVLALVLTSPASAAEIVTEVDRFRLWNGCQPVDLVIEGLSDDARKIDLRKEDVGTTVRSRLRGARIYQEHRLPYLYVNAFVTETAFSVDVEFVRLVEALLPFWYKPEGMDPLTGDATSWSSESAGTHGGRSDYILSWIARHTDEFIDEYLRVNADACRSN